MQPWAQIPPRNLSPADQGSATLPENKISRMHQIPCRDLIQAHCLRSWLLSHQIEAEVIHENSSGIYLPGILPAQVAIADADVPKYEALAAEQPDPPLEDSFEPVEEEDVPKENPRLGAATLPTLGATIITCAAIGFALGLVVLAYIFLAALLGGAPVFTDRPLPSSLRESGSLPFELALACAIGAIPIYCAIWLANSCKDKDGHALERSRWVALILVLFATPAAFVLGMAARSAYAYFTHWRE